MTCRLVSLRRVTCSRESSVVRICAFRRAIQFELMHNNPATASSLWDVPAGDVRVPGTLEAPIFTKSSTNTKSLPMPLHDQSRADVMCILQYRPDIQDRWKCRRDRWFWDFAAALLTQLAHICASVLSTSMSSPSPVNAAWGASSAASSSCALSLSTEGVE